MKREPSYTVTQLMVAFRQALVALGPSVELAGIAWTDGDAYDEWDLIEEVLFEVLVASAVRGDLSLFASSRPFVPYGYGDAPYSNGSWVGLIGPGLPGSLALIRLNSPNGFGDVRVAHLDEQGDTLGEFVVPWTSDVTFVAQLRAPEGTTVTRADIVTPTDSSVRHPRLRR